MKAGQLGAVVVVAAALVAALMIGTLLVGVGTSTTTTTRTVTSTQTSTSTANSTNGLQLRLSINASQITSDQRFLIQVSEYNTLGTRNNVTRGNEWKVSQVSLGECGVADFPFGVALFQGHDTAMNLSTAKQVDILPFVACPLALRYVSGYLFEPHSVQAFILPAGNLSTAFLTPMSKDITVSGQYSNNQKAQPLPAGNYTVVAADEWGNLVTLYLQVTGQSAMAH